MWLAGTLKKYREPLSLDFAELKYSINEIGHPELPRGLYIDEAYYLIKNRFSIPGSWLYAELNDELMPISLIDEAGYMANRWSFSHDTARFDKSGKPSLFKHGIFKDENKRKMKKHKATLDSLSDFEKNQLAIFLSGGKAFENYTTIRPTEV